MFGGGGHRSIRSARGGGCRAIERAVLREDGSIVLVFIEGDPTPVTAASITLDELHRLASRPLGQLIFQSWVNSLSFRSDALPTTLTVVRPESDASETPPTILH